MKLTAFTQKIDRGMAAFQKNLKLLSLRKAFVKAGVIGDKSRSGEGSLTNPELASVHEYGLGSAPARPWIRPPFVANRQAYLEILMASYSKAMFENAPVEYVRALGLVGARMANDIKRYVTDGSGVPPPNAPSTVARKGSSRPLVDTNQMVGGVTWLVERG